MTQKFIEMRNLSNVSMDSLPKGSTPIQAYLTSIKKSIDSGESSIAGLSGMAETDRPFVSKIIQSHLDQYGKGAKEAISLRDIGVKAEMKTVASAPRRMPLQKATAATQAKIASSVVMETVEDNVGRVVQRSGATSRLLGAATEASSHVAGGAAKSGLLRQAAAAATILKTIT
jgi:hypothetical protein